MFKLLFSVSVAFSLIIICAGAGFWLLYVKDNIGWGAGFFVASLIISILAQTYWIKDWTDMK